MVNVKSLILGGTLVATVIGFEGNTIAQPIIDSTTLPLPNLFMTYGVDTVASDSLLLGTGPNQVWDFSNLLQLDYIDTTFYLHPDSTPFASEPFAQSALYALNDLGIYTYLERFASSSGPEAYDVTTGIAGINPLIGSFSAPATDRDTLLLTPLTYNSIFFDDGVYEFSTTFSGIPVDVRITVTHYDTANGYGTLILPNMTVNNVLKITRKITIITEANSSIFGQVFYQEDSMLSIYFVAEIPGFRFPILTVTKDLTGDTVEARFLNFSMVVDFTASTTNALVGQPINFTNLSMNADSFVWDFGDGTTSNAVNPTHVYTTSGTYTVQLIGTYSVFGVSDTTTKVDYITVYDSVNADFSYTVQNMTVTFTNQSTGADSYMWDFGDGNTSTDVNPVHVYANPGEYTVKLVATNPVHSDSVAKTVKVGVVGVSSPVQEPIITIKGSTLMVLINGEPALVEIFTVDGKLIYSAEANVVKLPVGNISFPVLMVKVNGRAYKVSIRNME